MQKVKAKLKSLSVVFPAYNDEHTIGALVKKTLKLLPKLVISYEIIIVNDGSTDRTGAILQQLHKQTKKVTVITHSKNKGYGAALMSGFKKAKKKYIFYTDGDEQYDILEIPKLVAAMDENTDIVSGFKLNRQDSWIRKLIGGLYNSFVKSLLDISVKDIDCDFRIFRKSLVRSIRPIIKSGAFDAAFMKSLSEKKVRFREVGVHHYKRPYGHSQFFHPKRIARSLWDVLVIWFTYAE